MENESFDLVIIGAGPAGLTAGLYSARSGLRTLIMERIIPGGYVASISHIENYPGFVDGIRGFDLATMMKDQALKFGVTIKGVEVTLLRAQGKGFIVATKGAHYAARSVVIATGTTHRMLGVPGEDALRGRGVSYCATCDGPLFKGKTIAVIGCGNSGLQEGRFLLNFVQKIIFIETLSSVMADPVIRKPLEHESRAQFLLDHEVISINGDTMVQSITVKDRSAGKNVTYDIDGVFIYAGLVPLSRAFKDFVKCDPDGFIITDLKLQTNVPGVFAAGDIRAHAVRQIVTACGDGATAAMNAYQYIRSMEP
ncbi:FAD-dependent oxidoreductase [candidate division WOR-3 bacterium]|nr:FAD-dependent oxidoreductase [candidate division WOR-3 bacterium]